MVNRAVIFRLRKTMAQPRDCGSAVDWEPKSSNQQYPVEQMQAQRERRRIKRRGITKAEQTRLTFSENVRNKSSERHYWQIYRVIITTLENNGRQFASIAGMSVAVIRTARRMRRDFWGLTRRMTAIVFCKFNGMNRMTERTEEVSACQCVEHNQTNYQVPDGIRITTH